MKFIIWKNWLFINDQDTGIKNVDSFSKYQWVKVQTVQVRNKS